MGLYYFMGFSTEIPSHLTLVGDRQNSSASNCSSQPVLKTYTLKRYLDMVLRILQNWTSITALDSFSWDIKLYAWVWLDYLQFPRQEVVIFILPRNYISFTVPRIVLYLITYIQWSCNYGCISTTKKYPCYKTICFS